MSEPRISVVVPVKDQLAVTKRFWAMLKEQQPASFDRLYVMDDGSARATTNWLDGLMLRDERVRCESTAGLTIYEAWNRGFWRARQEAAGGEFHVAILNNDVVISPHALAQMSAALSADVARVAAYPDFAAAHDFRPRTVDPAPHCEETSGVWGTGGMLGFCFMLAGHRIPWRPLVQDLAYKWWYGDNHLARSIELAGGKQVKVVGLPIEHEHEATARHYDLAQAKVDDRLHWEAVLSSTLRHRPPQRGARVVARRDWRR